MPAITLHDTKGAKAGSIELAADVFGIQPNVPVMHQVVTAQLAARRSGTQSTKTRAEVRGGGAKPYRQKGTGNARQGSTRAPHYSGGGIALGPKPRSYQQKTPKKMIRLALRSALSDRAGEGKIVVVGEWGFERPSTKAGAALLAALGVSGKVLVVVRRDDTNAILSLRNLPEVQLIEVGELNAYDVLCNEWIVFSQATLPAGEAASPEATPAPAATSTTKAATPNAAAPDAASAAGDVEPAEWAGSARPLADGSEPAGHPIKGNAQSMLYHEPGTRYYKQTKAEVWFDTAESAEAAGFSKPGAADDKDGE
jgi:large subunit ribosomal protein L4